MGVKDNLENPACTLYEGILGLRVCIMCAKRL